MHSAAGAIDGAAAGENDPDRRRPRGRIPPAIASVTHNSLGDLERYFAGQVETARELRTAIVVVDNASTDGTLEFLADWQRRSPRVRLVSLPENRGYAAAVNEAFHAVPGRDVMLLNPDVELAGPEVVEHLSHLLELEPAVAVAGPRLVDADGHVQASARRFPSLLTLAGDLPILGRMPAARRSRERYGRPSRSTEPRTVDWVIGGAMLVRREAFERVGGWDAGYFLYVEDTDFCRRCIRDGWEIAFVPTVSLLHRYRRASGRENGSAHRSRVRRRHIRSHLRHFVRAPSLALGGGRTRSRRLGVPEPRGDERPESLAGDGADGRELAAAR